MFSLTGDCYLSDFWLRTSGYLFAQWSEASANLV